MKKTTCYARRKQQDTGEAPTTFLLVLDGEPEAASLTAAWLALGVPVVEIKRV